MIFVYLKNKSNKNKLKAVKEDYLLEESFETGQLNASAVGVRCFAGHRSDL